MFAGSLGGRSFSSVVGVRVEKYASGYQRACDQLRGADAAQANDATQYGVSPAGTATVSKSNHYTDMLPNLSFKWALTDDITARFAACQTMTRPTLEQLSPVTTLVTLRPGNFAGGQRHAGSGAVSIRQPRPVVRILLRRRQLHFHRCVLRGREQLHRPEPDDRRGEQFVRARRCSILRPDCRRSSPSPRPRTAKVRQVYGLRRVFSKSFGDSGFGIQLNGTLAHSDKDLDPPGPGQQICADRALQLRAMGCCSTTIKSNLESSSGAQLA